jgi:hypothetical protein
VGPRARVTVTSRTDEFNLRAARAYNRPVKGAPITIRCECGEARHVDYGESWVCESCGRRWNTAQIPAAEYWGIMREMRRMRLSVIGVALAESLLLVLPVVLAGWLVLYMPWWRRKVRRRARSVPKWNLRPE